MVARPSRSRRYAFIAPFLFAVAFAACSSAPSEDAASSSEALAASTRAATLGAIREIEDHRLLGDAELAGYLSSTEPSVLAAAATAVGRIGDPSLQASVVALLSHPVPSVRQAAAFALGLLGSANEGALDAQLAAEHDMATRATILRALGQAGTATSIPAMAASIAALESDEQTAAAEAYGTLVRGGVVPSTDPSVVTELVRMAGRSPELRSIAAAYALSTLPAAQVKLDEASLTGAFHAAPSASARGFLTTALASLGTTTSVQTLVAASATDPDPRVRASACGALATTGSSASVLAALQAALGDGAPSVVVAAATAIGTLGAAAPSLVTAIDATYDSSSSAWVRSTALSTLVGVSPSTARSRVTAGLTDEWPVQLVAIGALPSVATSADVPTLTALATGTNTRLAYAAIEALSLFPPTIVTPLTSQVKAAMTTALATKDWEIASGVADASVAFGWTDFAAPLAAVYSSLAGDAAMNGRLEIVWALGTIGSSADLPLLQSAIGDAAVLVSEYAAASYQQLSGVDVSSQVRKENVVTTKTPSNADVARALDSLVVLETTRGTIVIQMLPETPLNAVNFVRLASRGFYDGLPFHRVIPNFVAQGGDPRGDGTGGSKYLVRDELSQVPHLAGTVGLASEGKDTGSSQFFFNEGWNVHLDERYTVFGRVVFGLESAEALEVGDSIQRAMVMPVLAP